MTLSFEFQGTQELSFEENFSIDGGGFFDGIGVGVGYVSGYISEAFANIAAGFHDAAHDINSKR